MHFKENTPVVTADGHRVGDVARVVVDPRSREVTAIIVREGFLFTEDRVVPMDLVTSTSTDEVRLRDTKDTLPELLPLEEQHFVPVDDEDLPLATPGAAQPLYSYPPAGVGWWGMGYTTYWPGQRVTVETERHIPADSVVLNTGARVVSADGQHVGDVEEVIADSTSGRATHLVVAAGWLFTTRKIIPTGWIDRVNDEEVRLSVPARVLERLPAYER